MKLPEPTLKHSIGVAEFMATYAETHPDKKLETDKMYVTGLLHDIGKLYPGDPDPKGKNKYKNHAQKGGELLHQMGFNCYKDIKHHGHPETKYFSVTWLILNLADLSINGKGKKIPIKNRLMNIKERYGEYSEEYLHAKEITNILMRHNIIRQNYTVI